MSLHPEVVAVLARLAALPPVPGEPVEARRRALRERTGWLAGPPDPAVRRTDPGGPVRARLYTPPDADAGTLVLYAHGGGWVTGGLDSHDALCAALAGAAGCLLLAVDYRLAPEHPYPAAVDDMDAAARWVLGGGVPEWTGRALVPAGDSAGGNLAAVLAARLRGTPALRGQLLLYPIVDLPSDHGSYARYATGFSLDAADMAWFWDRYAPGRPTGPALTPLRTPDLTGLPPALVVTAGYDVLRDEGEAYAGRLRAAGVPAELVLAEGMVHGFLRMVAAIPAGASTVDRCGAFVRAVGG